MARAQPSLADALGERFRPQFAAYAATHPLPAGGGACPDATAFADWLRADRGGRWRGSTPLEGAKSAR